jgi:hypothetical protein
MGEQGQRFSFGWKIPNTNEAIFYIYLLNDINTIYKVVNDPRLDLHTLSDLGSNMHIIWDLGSIGVVEKPLSLSSLKIILTLHLGYSTWDT